MMYSIHQAKTQLSKLVASAEAGEEVVIARGKTPVAVLKALPPLEPTVRRTPGAWKGRITLTEAFFEPLPEDELRLWEGEGD